LLIAGSAYWRKAVDTYILPWVLDGLDIGANVLEVGPGPGVTTDLLRGRVDRPTCVEIDRAFADSLSRRMSGHNVTVVRQDATAMSFPDATFDGALSFTMLLHLLDTMVVVDPCTFPARLRKAGFADVQVDVLKPYAFRFRARKATITFPTRDEVLGV